MIFCKIDELFSIFILNLDMSKIYFFVFIILPFSGIAQRALDITSVLKTYDNRVYYQFSYTLLADKENIPAHVRLRIKTLDKEFYATDVTGEVGELIYPGSGKVFIWDYGRELVHFSGDIEFFIEVEPMIAIQSKVKRAREVAVTFRKSFIKDTYKAALYQNGALVWTQEEQLKGDTFRFFIPKRTKIKRGYQVGIVSGEETYFSNTFKIKPRLGRFVYILTGLGVVGTILLPDIMESFQPLPEAPNID